MSKTVPLIDRAMMTAAVVCALTVASVGLSAYLGAVWQTYSSYPTPLTLASGTPPAGALVDPAGGDRVQFSLRHAPGGDR